MRAVKGGETMLHPGCMNTCGECGGATCGTVLHVLSFRTHHNFHLAQLSSLVLENYQQQHTHHARNITQEKSRKPQLVVPSAVLDAGYLLLQYIASNCLVAFHRHRDERKH